MAALADSCSLREGTDRVRRDRARRGLRPGLCERFAAEVGLVVSVMGEGGVIVAPSAKERIGGRQAVAAEIMAGRLDERLVPRL